MMASVPEMQACKGMAVKLVRTDLKHHSLPGTHCRGGPHSHHCTASPGTCWLPLCCCWHWTCTWSYCGDCRQALAASQAGSLLWPSASTAAFHLCCPCQVSKAPRCMTYRCAFLWHCTGMCCSHHCARLCSITWTSCVAANNLHQLLSDSQ